MKTESCETYECENRPVEGKTMCSYCTEVRDDARRTYRQPYTREEIIDAYSDPTERAKRDSLLMSLEQ